MTVTVEDYNEDWPKWFAVLHSRIWPAVQDTALSIEHVGSTSVPGLAAKPVIDIDIIIDSDSELPTLIDRLRELGYEHRGNLGIEGREAFRSPDGEIKHNLYVCLKGVVALKNHLTLRDHLRKYPNQRDEYSSLKRKLAGQCPDLIDDYIEGKTTFILRILSQYKISEEQRTSIAAANRAPLRRP